MIESVLIPVSIMGGLGLVFGLGLSYASKKLVAPVDERVAAIRDILPGANCGACGTAGCDSFAESVVEGSVAVNGCPVGGTDVAKAIGSILGVEAGEVEAKTARVLCGGTLTSCKVKYNYSGIQDCAAAASLHGGPMACTYGCVGLGNCARACEFGAITIKDGLAVVDETKCTACTKCVAACPKNIIKMMPKKSEYTVRCSSPDKGPVVRKNCSSGCIGCTLCVKKCPHGAIKMNGALAVIDPELCQNCGECVKVCPTKAIDLFLNSEALYAVNK